MPHLTRIIYMLAGLCCVGLGALGAVLPLLPTVPFMLLALACFARSSQRFHDWLFHHKRFGPPLQQWSQHRVIPRRAKIVALASMALSAGYVVACTATPWPLIALMLCVMGYGAYFILSKPSAPTPSAS